MGSSFDIVEKLPEDKDKRDPGLDYPYVVQRLLDVIGVIHEVVVVEAGEANPPGIRWRGPGDAWMVVTRASDNVESREELETRMVTFLKDFATRNGRQMCLVTSEKSCIYFKPSGEIVNSEQIPKKGLLLLLSSMAGILSGKGNPEETPSCEKPFPKQ